MHSMADVSIVLDFLIEKTPVCQLPQADAIFVFGHNDPRVAEHAAQLYQQQRAPQIIVSGGVGPRTNLTWRYESEAEHYQAVLINLGVPLEAIVVENKATNTLENVRFGIPAAMKAGVKLSSVIAVAMPPLLRRALATLRHYHPEIQVYGSSFDLTTEDWIQTRHKKRLVGEIERLEIYGQRGDISLVVIPNEVMAAHLRLRKRFPAT